MSDTLSQPPIEVTEEMIEAGVEEFEKYVNIERADPVYSIAEIVRAVYAAMHSKHSG